VSNPFESAEAFETYTDTYLGIGNHRVKIEVAEDASSKKEHKPQIALQFRNANGTKRDWCNYNEKFLGKVVALYDSAGVERPKEGEFDVGDHCRLSKACIERLVGREVGIVIRPEADQDGVERERVKGYVKPDQVDDAPAATSNGNGGSSGASASTASDAELDDIPF
jgi:hypothetical protein